MKIPTKKLQSGFEMPVYGLGTWEMGGRKERDFDNDDDADVAAIQAALEQGVTHIDTAEIYADGYTEQLLGRAIQGYDRSKLFITSKVLKTNMAHDDLMAACQKSIERIGTSYLDLYLLHSYSPEVDLKEAMQALDELMVMGLIRHIGVANFSKERLEEAQNYTTNKIVCDQVYYNMEYRAPERNMLVRYCQENDVFFVAFRPTGRGKFSQDIPTVVREMCNKYGKTPTQIAINWLISQDTVLAISKTRSIEHLKENLGALGWEMEKSDIERIRDEYPNEEEETDIFALR